MADYLQNYRGGSKFYRGGLSPPCAPPWLRPCLSSCHRTASDANLSDDPHTFHYNYYFVFGGIRICLEVSNVLVIFSNSCPLNLLLVRSHQAEIIIIVKRLIQGRNNVNRKRVEPGPFDQSRRKNDAFTHSATPPTKLCIYESDPNLLRLSKICAQARVTVATRYLQLV